ncbi:hypothetical protein CASFOL_013083 [Castilleja foliolosa]|uniref:Cyclic nucleotide-binding domain-containing protein n=1 Tax=Castilleja foliolosa TaxID=1961234 RepID=A0ABD3DIZ1_9LAMI
MDIFEKDKTPMLSPSNIKSDERIDSTSRKFSTGMRSSSASNSFDSYKQRNNVAGPTGLTQMSGPLYITRNNEAVFQPPQLAKAEQSATEPKLEGYPSLESPTGNNNYECKNENLLKSGPLGMCDDPYCTTCPTNYHVKGRLKLSRTSKILDEKFRNIIHGDAKGYAKRMCSFLQTCIPGVMNPHAKIVQQWNKFFVISCLFAVFLDPLFFFLLSTQKDHKCIVLNWTMAMIIVVLRSMTDFIYFLHILLQFRLAYVAPESRVMGAGDLVDDPKKIACHYLFGCFILDLFVVLPLPQIIVLWLLPSTTPGANNAKNLLRAAILIQYVPRLYRFLPLLAGQSPTGLIFESAWANFIINLLMFVLASHVVGSCWYLFGLQRVNQCLRNACRDSHLERCMEFIDCGEGDDFTDFEYESAWGQWQNNINASKCFEQNGFAYGIYENAIALTTNQDLVTKYVYSLFWGFQQISTLAGNQVPSYFVGEVLFTMAIIGIGLLLFALLIGNMQNFLQSLGRRRLEMSLRRRDVEQWMRHRRLPEKLRSLVREAERYNWAATRGVNEEMLMDNLPEDLQRNIRRHLFKFVKKVRIFQVLDEPILDAIYERLRTKTYIKGSEILYRGGLVDKMIFVIRGKMNSVGEDLILLPLSQGDVCGEELLTWYLEHSYVNKGDRRIRIPGPRLLSNREVKCSTNVEAFVLRASDLEEVTSLFARFLRSPRVQGIRIALLARACSSTNSSRMAIQKKTTQS